MSLPQPRTVELDWPQQYRIVPSSFPPVDFFEGLVDPDLMEEAYTVESLTNDRLRDQVGDITLVASEDRVSGPGSTPVMAAFTHIGIDSRFSDGSYGVYYAARDMKTAVAETRYHRTEFLRATSEEPGDIDMRVYVGQVTQPMHDIRSGDYDDLHHADDWTPGQTFGAGMKAMNAWGLVYRSVRHNGGECIAAFRPQAVSLPVQGPHLAYVWNGTDIVDVIEKKIFRP